MTYDRFELTPEGEIRVNGRDLIEIIHEVELPYAQEEYDRRIAEGEDPQDLYVIAGEYLYPPPSMFFLPCRNLLDEPDCTAEREAFIMDKDDPRRGKALLLECTCGITGCWFLQARIEVGAEHVRWYDFSQFHRDWDYGLEFQFERRAYEKQLLPKKLHHQPDDDSTD